MKSFIQVWQQRKIRKAREATVEEKANDNDAHGYEGTENRN